MTINVIFPTIKDVVPAGQNGTISAEVEESFTNHFHSVDFCIKNSDNVLVWTGDGEISGDKATVNLKWPDSPGIYTLNATCKGLLGFTLAEHRTTFKVESRVNLI